MQIFNFSKDSEYHIQRNNQEIPFSACNTTSIIMGLKQARWPIFFAEEGVQEEDTLTRFLLTSEAYEKMKELAPWAYRNGRAIFPPNQVHCMLEWAVNKLMGQKVDKFIERATLKHIITHLLDGGGIVISGIFTVNDRNMGHIVSMAGFYTNQDILGVSGVDISQITHIIIDDPYGNYQTDYRDHRGNDILMPIEEFNRTFNYRNELNQKWAHFIKPYKEAV